MQSQKIQKRIMFHGQVLKGIPFDPKVIKIVMAKQEHHKAAGWFLLYRLALGAETFGTPLCFVIAMRMTES